MKCKNCGAELTMLEKFCPNCGTPNEQSQQHIKDMEHYEHEFSDTQKEVVRNSKWFIKYIAPVTSLVIAGIAAVIVTIQANHLWGYNLAEQKQKKYNQTHEQEIKEHLQTLLDNGQYEEVYQLYTRLNQRMSGTGNSGWYDFYNMTEGYLRLRNAIMFYYNPEYFNNLSREKFIEYLNAEGIPAFICFPVLSDTTFFKNNEFYNRISDVTECTRYEIPHAKKIAREVVWIPHYTLLGDEKDIAEIYYAIKKIQDAQTNGDVHD